MKLSYDQLSRKIHSVIGGYRAHERNALVKVSPEKILEWVRQFDVKYRRAILVEMENVFRKRYFSINRAKRSLHKAIKVIAKNKGFKNPRNFLKHTQVLRLQGRNKSQSHILDLLDDVLLTKFNISINNCGSESRQFSLYVDDMLCTGTTLMNDINGWLSTKYNNRTTNLKAVVRGSTELICFYLFAHTRNYNRKIGSLRHNYSYKFTRNISFYSQVWIENENGFSSNVDFLFPIKTTNKTILKYKDSINNDVDDYVSNKGYEPLEKFFRSIRSPRQELFFTNSKRREKVEEAFLLKGIEILKSVNVTKRNIRSLGFALPSERNFGFGTLCFTWRNVSNNLPLVFWYSASNFKPLFERRTL